MTHRRDLATVLGVALIALTAGCSSAGRKGPTASPSTTSPSNTPVPAKAGFSLTSAPPPRAQPITGLPPLACPPATVTVDDAAGLQAALDGAKAGTVIRLADGIYPGRFMATASGTPTQPIWVCGSRMAIIDSSSATLASASSESGSDNVDSSPASEPYGLHLVGASWWRLVGFSVRNGVKGIVLDQSDHDILHQLTVYNIGEEGIHLREFSSDNVVEGCVVRSTGLQNSLYGEGIYIGSAVSNWARYTEGRPDASDNNVVRYSDISDTTAENIDIKEGTTGGLLEYNHFDGTGMISSAATSWVNVKGNDYTISRNTGENSPANGFSTHEVVAGWGRNNVFSSNQIGPGVPGYGFAFYSPDNALGCDNTGAGAKGQANVSC